MNYIKIYKSIITRAATRPKLECYTEKHHIIPRCMGGSDEVENIAVLTPEEHYVAHQLLVKIYPKHDGIVYAATMMCADGHGTRVNNKLYSWLKAKMSQSKKGKLHTEESRCKMRIAKQNISEETRQKLRLAKQSISDETRQKLRLARQNISEETRRKLGDAKRGKKLSPEHIALRQASRERNKGLRAY